MNLLLDTHVALWTWREPEKLSGSARVQIEDPGNEIWVSAAAAWEIALKWAAGKLDYVPERFGTMMQTSGFGHLAITAQHAIQSAALPRHHANPFDRMMIAQARCEALVLVTADRQISQYDVAIFPAR